MGTVIEFPVQAPARRPDSTMATDGHSTATIVILPVVRIERHPESHDGSGPEQGSAAGRRRRRRARN